MPAAGQSILAGIATGDLFIIALRIPEALDPVVLSGQEISVEIDLSRGTLNVGAVPSVTPVVLSGQEISIEIGLTRGSLSGGTPVSIDVPTLTAVLAQIDATTVERYWTGDTPLTYDGNAYSSIGKLLGVGVAEQRVDVPNIRLQIVIDLSDTTVRTKFLSDRGPLDTTITFIKSTDNGATWSATGWVLRGKLSTPDIRNQALTVEVETFKGDVDRGRIVAWSHEEQQRRHTGDKGFAYLRPTTHQNPKRNLRWPPGA